MRYLAAILVISLPTVAYADDARRPELVHLVAASMACNIQLDIAALNFIDGLPQGVAKLPAETEREEVVETVKAEMADQGVVTFCWNTWDKLRASGFLATYYPVYPAPDFAGRYNPGQPQGLPERSDRH